MENGTNSTIDYIDVSLGMVFNWNQYENLDSNVYYFPELDDLRFECPEGVEIHQMY